MGAKLKYTEGEIMYEIDGDFLDTLDDLHPLVAVEISNQIDWNAMTLPETKFWSTTYAGVVKNIKTPVYFLVKYQKEEDSITYFLDLEIVDSDTYLDYYLLNKILL